MSQMRRKLVLLRAEGASNVIQVACFGDEVLYARALRTKELAGAVRAARARELERMTRQPIGNDNEPAPRWTDVRDRSEDDQAGHVRSPALRRLMR